ncbi:hypothetical protein [Streptomyces cellostaticus]|uniref:hypothetical protein n=1 Tax=Streptomyces cellostaticus TaxID=67285 RepID=UPI002026F2FF|nr:hypothetical protein [Streptomyces cellostaticus]
MWVRRPATPGAPFCSPSPRPPGSARRSTPGGAFPRASPFEGGVEELEPLRERSD